jgi:rhodanese-related sulfurtransferase
MHCAYTLRLLLLLLLSFTCASARAAEVVSPENIPGVTRVDSDGVINLVNTIPDLIVIDARIPSDRKQGFIEGSVSLPDVDTTCAALQKIVAQKSLPVLFYCNGVKCGRSVKAIKVAQGCGYERIYWFRGGFEEWKAKGYPFITE